jgi:hypothetical protein
MDELRQMLTNHLRGRGLPGDHITSYLKSLEKLIESEPGIEPAQLNQKLHALGWDEVTLDYHHLQIAIACFENDLQKNEPPNDPALKPP